MMSNLISVLRRDWHVCVQKLQFSLSCLRLFPFSWSEQIRLLKLDWYYIDWTNIFFDELAQIWQIVQPELPPGASVSSYLSKFVLHPVSSRRECSFAIPSASSPNCVPSSRREYASVSLRWFPSTNFSAIIFLRWPQWTLFWLHTITAGKSICEWIVSVTRRSRSVTGQWVSDRKHWLDWCDLKKKKIVV